MENEGSSIQSYYSTYDDDDDDSWPYPWNKWTQSLESDSPYLSSILIPVVSEYDTTKIINCNEFVYMSLIIILFVTCIILLVIVFVLVNHIKKRNTSLTENLMEDEFSL